ncbi:MAG: hypothetical protein H0U65_06990 [Rubrobacter sp.]|nr:hypothetical protein [Rubrobacter sp.]
MGVGKGMKAKPVPAVASSESGAGRSGGKANVHVRRKSRTTRLPTPEASEAKRPPDSRYFGGRTASSVDDS